MLDDAFKSVKAYLYERNSSPLLGSFVTSWIIWNYKTIFLLFSDLKYNEKLDWIEKFYSTEGTRELLGIIPIEVSNFAALGLLFPALTAAFYLFIFPWPSRWVYHFSLWQQKLTSDLRKDVEKNQLLTLEESQKIRMDLAQAEKDIKEQFNASIDKKDREIELLKSELTEFKKKSEGKSTGALSIEDLGFKPTVVEEEPVDTKEDLPLNKDKPYAHNAEKLRNDILAYMFSNDNMKLDYLTELIGNPKLVKYYIDKLSEEQLLGYGQGGVAFLSSEGQDEAVAYLSKTTKDYSITGDTMANLRALYPSVQTPQQLPQQQAPEQTPPQQQAPTKRTKMVRLDKEFKLK